MATVSRVLARGVHVRPDRPTETAAGVMTTQPIVLIDLYTRDGVIGRSYLRSYTPAALGALTQLVADLGALIVGGPAAPGPIRAALLTRLRLLGVSGLAAMALAGIDMAAWDALARGLGLPLATLLGGEPHPVRAYRSLQTMQPGTAAAEGADAVSEGFTAVKLKVGRAGLAEDLAAIRAVRSAVGDAVAIMVDYNQSLTVADALARSRVLDDEGVTWIEEPTDASDHAGHARIAVGARTPVQLGENWSSLREVAGGFAAGACDLATFDVMRLGGVTGWQQAVGLAAAAGMPVSSHAFPEFSAHLLAVTPTADWLEYLDHLAPIRTEPVAVQDGRVGGLDGAGAGLEWDEARVADSLAVAAEV